MLSPPKDKIVSGFCRSDFRYEGDQNANRAANFFSVACRTIDVLHRAMNFLLQSCNVNRSLRKKFHDLEKFLQVIVDLVTILSANWFHQRL